MMCIMNVLFRCRTQVHYSVMQNSEHNRTPKNARLNSSESCRRVNLMEQERSRLVSESWIRVTSVAESGVWVCGCCGWCGWVGAFLSRKWHKRLESCDMDLVTLLHGQITWTDIHRVGHKPADCEAVTCPCFEV